MRIYQPTTLADLSRHWPTGSIPVTDDVVVAEGEGEEEEYAALDTAADLSVALLPGGRGRRVVVVGETDDAEAPIPVRRVVAVHVDESDDPDFVAGPDDALAWYATQEVPHLLPPTR